jgi:phospholipid/cholesterol/gamma-HCH transport system ATP-binding protein
MMTALIEAKHIVNVFGTQKIHDGVNLTLEEGEILGLVGSSGSGKSVLLRTILGLHPPLKGHVLVNGKDIYAVSSQARQDIQKDWGVLFQDGALFSGLSVMDNIGLPLREHSKLSEKEIEKRALEKLEMVGLEDSVAQKFPSELSGGMARRVALARALARQPQILFLDEPTDGLDPVAAADFDELVLSLKDELALSIFMITHDLDTLITVCDRIAMIVDHKVKTGTIEDMMRAHQPQIQAFFNGPRMHHVLGKAS